MKNNVLLTASLAALYTITSCAQSNVPQVEGSRTDFAMSFFRSVNASAPKNENVVISPYSAGVALSMLMEGAEGQTRAELDNALNGCVFKVEDLGGEDMTVASANSVWIDDDFSVRNHYVNLLQKDYDALAETLNFADPATLRAINNWCSEHTDGKITEILDTLSPNMVMVLLNALYFNAPWEFEFDPALTSDAGFKGREDTSTVKMMYRKGTYSYAEYQGCQMIALPYKGLKYAMYVVLPSEKMNVEDIIPYINNSTYKSAIQAMEPCEVAFRMPKLKLETSLVLNETLKRMGVESAFTSAADLKGISVMGPLVVDKVQQKCHIDISEGGTEAAAVTSIQMRLTSARPQQNLKKMTVDRPYLFFIADTETDNVMFAGKIIKI